MPYMHEIGEHCTDKLALYNVLQSCLSCFPTSASGFNLQFRRLLNLLSALTEQLIQDNDSKGCRANPTYRKAGNSEGCVAKTKLICYSEEKREKEISS